MMLKARPCSLLILTFLLLPCALAQKQLETASFELGLAVLNSVEKGTSAVLFPHSIVDTLDMLLEGANGGTKTQLLRQVFSTHSMDFVENYHKQRQQRIASYSETNMNYIDIVSLKNGTKLGIVIRTLKDRSIRETRYVQENSESTMKSLNYYVSRITNYNVEEAFKPEPQDSPLVLTNAVHFKALWQTKFLKNFTNDREFFVQWDKCRINGQNPIVPLMIATKAPVPYKKFRYLGNSEGVRLPFGEADNETSFYVLLPDRGVKVQQLINVLNGRTWMKIVRDLASADPHNSVDVMMPAFNASSSIMLGNTLKGLGVTYMFDRNRANFTKFNASSPLYVKNIEHRALLKINEQGAGGAMMPDMFYEKSWNRATLFKANRPFVYVIADTQSGHVYFIGRFEGPNC